MVKSEVEHLILASDRKYNVSIGTLRDKLGRQFFTLYEL